MRSANYIRQILYKENEMSDQILTTNYVYARARFVHCPHCDAEIDGWLSDPRGAEETCESCGGRYRVDADADVLMD